MDPQMLSLPTESEDDVYRRKTTRIRKKVAEVEEECEKLAVKIYTAKRNIQRFRLEQQLLMNELESRNVPLSAHQHTTVKTEEQI
ncbi:hypothetical protein SJAG_02549 [Schizosaccharomyces japonicus yFS275]|uniref:INO80 complex subunit F domain-containing protein n=1 Tax=Schizosaccharomyces japonicus (strain yFS275 / FY16936) TaxID=402676 RepID=B6K0J3_SCHJY|nr:hypothetical protein SJAG_02549 [Schizosaccharomyces japonicus yFS275]EEB07464.1 hypothetical protein SJAG_02549 [Schizosaccharomyces japonicus yFS275]